MNFTLEKSSRCRAPVKEFNDMLALFYPGSPYPYAVRAPLDSPLLSTEADFSKDEFDGDDPNVSVHENQILCCFGISCSHKALITKNNKEQVETTVKAIEDYFRMSERVLSSDLSQYCNHLSLCELIAETADYCGCLTDINLPDNERTLLMDRTVDNAKSYSTIAALGAICLIFRRLSALRGFNFKLISNDGLYSLAFSAKILGEEIESIKDLPEYSALEDLDSNGGVTLYSRLLKLTPEDGKELQRLTLVLTPRAEDPSGILRAPEWKSKTRSSLDELELDIPGRF